MSWHHNNEVDERDASELVVEYYWDNMEELRWDEWSEFWV